MKRSFIRHRHEEAGNVVALTLLGLAVAILAGVAVLVLIGYKKQQPIPALSDVDVATNEVVVETDPYEGWATYTNTDLQFSIRYPEGWAVKEHVASDTPSVVVYDARGDISGTSTGRDVDRFEDMAPNAIHIRPRGPRENVVGEKKGPSTVILPIAGASAQDLVLEGTAQSWATIVHFEMFPATWNASGTIFARLPIAEEEVEYRRGAETIPLDSYDPTVGDHARRFGFVDPSARTLLERVLLSFTFVDDREKSGMNESSEGVVSPQQDSRSDILVTEPLANASVASPLVVRGVADARWFAEDSLFSVVLTDEVGNIVTIADVRADAAVANDVSELVPFVATLSFDPGTATSGALVFKPASSASAVTEHSIPVKFGIEAE